VIRPLLLAALVAAGPASALSCLPPDAVRLYQQADASAERYFIAIGRLHADREIRVPTPSPDAPETSEAVTRVRMTGHVLGETGFDEPFDILVDVKVTCLSIWCGSPVTDRDILAAVRLTGDVPELEIGPCGGLTMPAENADTEALLTCHRLGGCSPI
jgi:hypothetical protein